MHACCAYIAVGMELSLAQIIYLYEFVATYLSNILVTCSDNPSLYLVTN